jgi:membrane-associated protein
MPFDLPTLEELVAWGGYLGLFAIIFTETGLFVGFLLPGDSLLVTAGLLIANGTVPLDINVLIILLCVAAITGDTVGYWIGAKAGHALYSRPNSRWFRQDHLIKTREFYEKYGGMTIVMARFVPFARTFAPVVAGIAGMKYGRFLLFNIAGGIGWIVSMTLLGYYLGVTFPGIQKNVEYVIAAVILLSILPIIIKFLRRKKPAGNVPAPGLTPPAAPTVDRMETRAGR